MRAGRLKTKRYKTGRGGIGRLFLLILGIMLGAGAAIFWQGGNIPLPAGGVSLSPTPTLTPEQSIREEKKVTLPGHTWYALQVGAFGSASDARAAAESFRGRGAAGYVLERNGYQVLAAAYETRADAQAVQTQLREQHGVESLIIEIIQPEISLRLTGQQAQLTALSDAWDAIEKLAGHLNGLSQQMDRRAVSADSALPALASEKETLNALNARLLSLFGEAEHPAVRNVRALLSDLAAALPTEEIQSTVRLGAGIKYAQLLCVCRMAAYAAAIAEE